MPARAVLAVLFLSSFLGACASRPPTPVLFDLGPVPLPAVASPRIPPVALADPRSASWLSVNLIFYRLMYVNGQQPRPYAESRWAMAPAQLLRQRLAQRIADAGGTVASSRDTGPTLPVLHLEIDDFSHVFATPESSAGRIALRASVFDGRKLVAQRTFRQDAPAPTGDAAGGTLALSRAADAVITDLTQWLSTLPTARP